MAIATKPWQMTDGNDPFDSKFDVKDYAIGGKLIQASLDLTITDQMRFTDDELKREIKRRMSQDIARFMVESNLIEFTRIQNPTDLTMRIHARCYLAPDGQVKILRSIK
jgi:hypothetical protein